MTTDTRKTAALVAAIAQTTRVRILRLLAQGGPLHVGAMADALKVKMDLMSHHLGVMKTAGVLDRKRDGRRLVYGLHPAVFSNGTLDFGGVRIVLTEKAG